MRLCAATCMVVEVALAFERALASATWEGRCPREALPGPGQRRHASHRPSSSSPSVAVVPCSNAFSGSASRRDTEMIFDVVVIPSQGASCRNLRVRSASSSMARQPPPPLSCVVRDQPGSVLQLQVVAGACCLRLCILALLLFARTSAIDRCLYLSRPAPAASVPPLPEPRCAPAGCPTLCRRRPLAALWFPSCCDWRWRRRSLSPDYRCSGSLG